MLSSPISIHLQVWFSIFSLSLLLLFLGLVTFYRDCFLIRIFVSVLFLFIFTEQESPLLQDIRSPVSATFLPPDLSSVRLLPKPPYPASIPKQMYVFFWNFLNYTYKMLFPLFSFYNSFSFYCCSVFAMKH